MKITPDDFTALERGMIDTLKAYNLHPSMVRGSEHAWQLFNRAWTEKRIDGSALYAKYNDANIETAFRRMFR